MKLLEALKSGKRIRHIGWYDNKLILWQDPKHHLLISKGLIESDKWEIEGQEQKDKKK